MGNHTARKTLPIHGQVLEFGICEFRHTQLRRCSGKEAKLSLLPLAPLWSSVQFSNQRKSRFTDMVRDCLVHGGRRPAAKRDEGREKPKGVLPRFLRALPRQSDPGGIRGQSG